MLKSQVAKPFRRLIAGWAAGGMAMIFSGCAAIPQPYIPELAGPIGYGDILHGLEIRIEAEQERARLGDPITMLVTLENKGEQAIWIPRKPHIILFWVYPNGQRDNYVIEFPAERYYTPKEIFPLHPGQKLVITEILDTYYFPKPGITEFTAIYHAPRNSNPDILSVWAGRIRSNSYGIILN